MITVAKLNSLLYETHHDKWNIPTEKHIVLLRETITINNFVYFIELNCSKYL